jgi:hypothetical protein
MKMLWNRKEVFFLSRDANSSLKKVSCRKSPSNPFTFTPSQLLHLFPLSGSRGGRTKGKAGASK